jgi:regulator of cell morphogenesis and NO signaling
MHVNPTQSVASVVLDHSECAQVFQRHRIDFCCRGELSIEAAAQERGVALAGLLRELDDAIATRRTPAQTSWKDAPTRDLLAHIIDLHHGYLRRVLPFVRPLAAKVARVHGEHNPKLRALDEAVGQLADSLLEHLTDEEQRLFPTLLAADAPRAQQAALLANMQAEHLAMADQLRRIRDAADDYTLPEWACRSYTALFGELEALERDVFTHVHLENHVLRPRFDTA